MTRLSTFTALCFFAGRRVVKKTHQRPMEILPMDQSKVEGHRWMHIISVRSSGPSWPRMAMKREGWENGRKRCWFFQQIYLRCLLPVSRLTFFPKMLYLFLSTTTMHTGLLLLLIFVGSAWNPMTAWEWQRRSSSRYLSLLSFKLHALIKQFP